MLFWWNFKLFHTFLACPGPLQRWFHHFRQLTSRDIEFWIFLERICFCETQTIESWHKLEVAESPLIIDQYGKVGISLESWRAGDTDRHQDFQFWCRVSHEKWATRIGFNYLPITWAAHYSDIYSRYFCQFYAEGSIGIVYLIYRLKVEYKKCWCLCWVGWLKSKKLLL